MHNFFGNYVDIMVTPEILISRTNKTLCSQKRASIINTGCDKCYSYRW